MEPARRHVQHLPCKHMLSFRPAEVVHSQAAALTQSVLGGLVPGMWAASWCHVIHCAAADCMLAEGARALQQLMHQAIKSRSWVIQTHACGRTRCQPTLHSSRSPREVWKVCLQLISRPGQVHPAEVVRQWRGLDMSLLLSS